MKCNKLHIYILLNYASRNLGSDDSPHKMSNVSMIMKMKGLFGVKVVKTLMAFTVKVYIKATRLLNLRCITFIVEVLCNLKAISLGK